MLQCGRFGAWLMGEPMEGVVRWFADLGEVPLTPPAGLREHAPLNDDPDGPDTFTEDAIAGVAFALEYCDGRGWASMRTVRCVASDPVHPARLRAFCNIRQEERTFRVDRIISIADMRTGRILSSNEHVALLAPYVGAGSGDPDFAALFRLQDATRDGVFALLQLAMPSGRLSAVARVAVLNYVKAEAQALGLPRAPYGYVDGWVDNLAPPLHAVTAGVERLLTDKDRFARLLPWLLKVVRCQDNPGRHELAMRNLISEVRRHFRGKAPLWQRDLRAIR